MKLSIVIPVYYGEEIFEKCLTTLCPGGANYPRQGWEILVWNNGFAPTSWRKIQKKYPQVKFFGNGKENIGFARGNNFLLKKAKGKYVLILNQDVFIKPQAIESLIKFLDNNPEYACVAPQLRFPSGALQYSCRPDPKGVLFLLGSALNSWKNYYFFYSPDKSGTVDHAGASCNLWRSRMLKKLNGFDPHPHYFLYFNDVDLSYRLRKIGGKIYYFASVKAIHLHGKSTSLLPEGERIFHLYKGLGRFWFKMGSSYIIAYNKAFWGACIIGLGKIFHFLPDLKK